MPEPTLYLFDGYNLLHAGGYADVRELVDRQPVDLAGVEPPTDHHAAVAAFVAKQRPVFEGR